MKAIRVRGKVFRRAIRVWLLSLGFRFRVSVLVGLGFQLGLGLADWAGRRLKGFGFVWAKG